METSQAISSAPIHPTMLIDPEDKFINYSINSRGYNYRVTITRPLNQLVENWEVKVEEKFGQKILLSSLDLKKDVKTKENTLFGTTIFDLDNAVFLLFKSQNATVFFHFWSDNHQVAKDNCIWIQENLFQDKVAQVLNEETNQREVTFWGASGGDYSAYSRKVVLYDWNESFASNYSSSTREALNSLVSLQPPIVGGKLIILTGPPGTGKTSLLRCLAREWTHWCHSSYITDPEVFLGSSGAMLNVITWDYDRYINEKVDEKDAYHLLIIEDADELIRLDAKDRTGQAMSRLLNLGDGMLGHSTNLLICLSTNASIDELNPAIIRHGRCLANINFVEFNKKEAIAWLDSHTDGDGERILRNSSAEPNQTTFSLAFLYSILQNNTHIEKKKEEPLLANGIYL